MVTGLRRERRSRFALPSVRSEASRGVFGVQLNFKLQGKNIKPVHHAHQLFGQGIYIMQADRKSVV
jgi:hypothetical protein